MKIGGFYIIHIAGNPSCSDPQYTTSGKCIANGAIWDWYPPKGESTYETVKSISDSNQADFYWDGVLKLSFNEGSPFDANYKKTCTDSQYTNQKDCEDNGGKWEHQGWESGEQYEKGDLVYYQAAGTSIEQPEKLWYYCVLDNNSTNPPQHHDGNWEKVNLQSYIYNGPSASELEPDAYHVYDSNQSKRTHRYNEGGNATAEKAEMGPSDITKQQTKIYYNQENNPDQFYLAAQSHFDIYETCHGTRPLEYQGISGNYNFYNAAYPAGYYSPPFGETPTLTLVGSTAENETINALTDTDFTLENFMAGNCCPELDGPGEMGMWGIRTVFPVKGRMVTFDETRGDEHGIHAPAEECPPKMPPAYFFEEQMFGYHPGSIMAAGAGTFYNDNPFPNSSDIDGWFHSHVYNTQRCWAPGGVIYNGYKLKGSYPELKYPIIGSSEQKLNAGICKAKQCETSQLLGYNFAGVQLGFASGPGAAINDSASFATYDPFVYWHFVFRYNHDSLWNETQNTTSNKVVSFSHNEGEAENHLWEYRQCPNTPDFLPWSSDNPIHACPSHYFDIPYYAAIGKFGFYGARFFNSCSTPTAMVDDESDHQDTEYNYYTARRINADGLTFENKTYNLKALESVSDKSNATLRINNGCYEVTYVETTTDDRTADLVLSSTAPAWASKTVDVNLTYDVYEWASAGPFNLGHVNQINTITWDTVSFNISACQDCLDGGEAAIDAARIKVQEKIENKYGVSMAEINDMADGVGRNYCTQSPECDPFLLHNSVAFNPANARDPFNYLSDLLTTHAVRIGADNIHATDGAYSTVSARVDLVRDFPADVQDCSEYAEPSAKAGICNQEHYTTLLEIARNEQRLAEFFVGNIGFFIWSNYEHITSTNEYKNLLTGFVRGDSSEVHFKQCLYRLKEDFDQTLLSLPNLLEGLDDPVIYYETAGQGGLFGNETLNYSRQGLFNDLLFTNNRYKQFLSEIEWDNTTDLFSLAVRPPDNPSHVNQIDAWNKIVELYGSHIAVPGGQVNQEWYKTAIEGKEKRLLTRFVENKIRGRAIDLFPTNQVTFSTDAISQYISGKHWGNSRWGDNTAGDHRGSSFDPLPGGAQFQPEHKDDKNPGVTRQYFWGVYTHVSTVTGWHDRVKYAKDIGGEFYYAGLYQDFSCGGDRPIASYRGGGVAVGAEDKQLPKSPWAVAGRNDVGRVNQGFSCFSPIFIQQPMNVTCKIGQRPVFRSQAVDYHTIPEDKINQGYPEIDYWTNNLKLTNSKGEAKYPIQYKWFRVRKGNLPILQSEKALDELFYNSDPEVWQEASITGEWACMEGVSGVGTEDCTLFHPQATYTHEMVETTQETNGVPDAYKLDTNWGGRKYGADHWTKLVDYKGELHYINSSKKRGSHRLWKAFSYIQGAMTRQGRNEKDSNMQGGEALSACPTFSKTYTYSDMMQEKYGLSYLGEGGDDDYLYFCVASGRFGFRRSEHVNLDIEDWIKQDFAIRNGSPVSIPMQSIGYSYTRVDQEDDPLPDRPQSQKYQGVDKPYNQVTLKNGWGAETDVYNRYNNPNTPIPAFAGLERDANQVWENEVMEKINMTNNCRSFAYVGREGYRGTLRSFRPPTQTNIQGDIAERAGWFEYGLLYAFGNVLTQGWGNALYGQSQMPICRDYKMPKGCTAQGFEISMDLNSIMDASDEVFKVNLDACGNPTATTQDTNLVAILAQHTGKDPAKHQQTPPRMYHWSVIGPAIIVDNKRAGVPNTQQTHQGEHYNYYDDMMHTFGGYCGKCIAHHARGVSWQFENNLGKIGRFGKYVKLPASIPPLRADEAPSSFADNDDVYFWAWGHLEKQRREFYAAQRKVSGSTLAGVNCGWRQSSCGREMLYFVEAHQRYYISCGEKKRVINLSYMAPGLRAGSAGNQYFVGGFPNDTYVKRNGLLGPYAYEWRVAPHNRDRNGNGISESFYSMKHNVPIHQYDPPAIYGLWSRQTPPSLIEPQVEALRKLRNRAQGPAATNKPGHWATGLPDNVKGMFFGPHGTGKNGGCGSFRISCVETLHQKWRRPYRYGSGNEICDWYVYAIRLGLDSGHHYGCDEKQLLRGLCFDPCLSMKYNYGFFPGGKLLTVNNYVKYKESRHNSDEDESQAAGGVLGGKLEGDLDGDGKISESEATKQAQVEAGKQSTAERQAERIAKHQEGIRFMTQLTGNVDDEEVAISKNKSFKFARIMRGPWATPYRRIKNHLIEEPMSVNGSATSSDVVNVSKTSMDGAVNGTDKFQLGINQKPNKRLASSTYTDTSVSPCNSGGADHCNYITPTMNLGIDVTLEGFQAVFANTAGYMGNGYGPTSDSSAQKDFLKQMDVFTKFLVNSWDSAFGSNPYLDSEGNPIPPEEVVAALQHRGNSLETISQYMEDNCDGAAGSFFGNVLDNFGKFFDDTATTALQDEIARRSNSGVNGMLKNAMLLQMAEMYRSGRLVVVHF